MNEQDERGALIRAFDASLSGVPRYVIDRFGVEHLADGGGWIKESDLFDRFAASTSANVAQGADWSDRELNIHPDFKPFYAPFMKLWEAQVPTGDMKSLCFFFYRHGAQTANAAQGAEAQSGEAVCRVCNGHGYRTAMSATGEGAFNETCVYCKGTGKAAPPAQTALTDDARDAERYRRFKRWHPRLQTSYWTGQWWEPIYGEKMDACVDWLDEVPQPTPHADQKAAAQSASGDTI